MPETLPVTDAPAAVQSPPPAELPARDDAEPRARLHALARELVHVHNRRLLVEYLRLRRSLR